MNTVKALVIVVLVIIIMGLLGHNGRIQEINDKEIKTYQDSLEHLLYVNYLIQLENDSLLLCNDSLLSQPPKIKTIYREKYIFIEHSDLTQLDSIIRSGF